MIIKWLEREDFSEEYSMSKDSEIRKGNFRSDLVQTDESISEESP